MLFLSVSILFPFLLWRCYRLGRGVLSPTFLVQVYFLLIFIGALEFYFSAEHYTFVYVFAGNVAAWLGAEIATLGRPVRAVAGPLALKTDLDPSRLLLSLDLALFAVLSLMAWHMRTHGISLLTHDWYTVTEEEYQSGLTDRLASTVGAASPGVIAIAFYGLHRAAGAPRARRHFILASFAYLVINLLVGSKSSAIMPLLLLGTGIFYAERKLPARTLGFGALAALTLMGFIGWVWTSAGMGSGVAALYAGRLVHDSIETFDFLLYGPIPPTLLRPGAELKLELTRVAAQFTGHFRTPLFNEFVGNLYAGNHMFFVTGVSPELTLMGPGYANLGVAGILLYAFAALYLAQRVNLSLLRARHIGVFKFTALIGAQFQFLGFIRSGSIILAVENYALALGLPIAVAGACYLCLCVMQPASRRPRFSRHVRVSAGVPVG